MTDFAAILAQSDAAFEQTAAVGGVHPEGPHTGEITVSRVEQSDLVGDDTLNLAIHVRTPAGMAFGRVRLTNHPSEGSMGWAKGQLSNLGYTGTLSGVPAWAPSLIGQHVDIKVTHNTPEDGQHAGKTFVDVNFRKLAVGSVTAPAQAFPAFQPIAQAPADPAEQQFFAAAAAPAPVQSTPAPQVAPASPGQAVAAFDAAQAPAAPVTAAPTPLPFA